MTYTTQALKQGYQLLVPLADHHLEVSVKINHYDYQELEKLYFPVGEYSPSIVADYINELEVMTSDDAQYRVSYQIIDHRYIPVFDLSEPIAELKEGEEYLVEVVIKSPVTDAYYYFDSTLNHRQYIAFDKDFQGYVNYVWGAESVHILSVSVVTPPPYKNDGNF